MKTDHLIQAMAADTERIQPVETTLPAAALAATLVVAAFLMAGFGPRPDAREALTHLPVMFKQIFPVLLACGSLAVVLRLARPGAAPGAGLLLLIAVPIILILSVAIELAVLPAALWGVALVGHSLGECLASIPALALPVLAVSLWVLRRGASARPGLTGAAAGLMSGSAAAAVYAINCTEDSPLFYAVWYVIAILLVTGLGALIGRRVLRW